MIVGQLVVDFYLPWATSLKDKRQEISSILQKLPRKFNVSVAESDFQDMHQSAQISIVFLASSKTKGDSIMDNVINYIYRNTNAETVNILREFI